MNNFNLIVILFHSFDPENLMLDNHQNELGSTRVEEWIVIPSTPGGGEAGSYGGKAQERMSAKAVSNG